MFVLKRIMEEDLRAQEAFYQSGETPSATVIRAKPKTTINDAIQLPSIFSPVKEIKERVSVKEKASIQETQRDSGFPSAERINVIVNTSF